MTLIKFLQKNQCTHSNLGCTSSRKERGLFLDTLLDHLLPQNCLLCEDSSAKELLCPACRADLPCLPVESCPICAETSPGGSVCGQCLAKPPHFEATYAAFQYAFPVDKLIHALKYGHRLSIAKMLSQSLLKLTNPTADILIPVPLSAQRLAERGFNQSLEIARPLARAWHLPLRHCTRRIDTAPQASLPWKARHDNIRHAFECPLDLSGQSVLVIDDVMTTGATLNEFARILKGQGAIHITNLVAARTLK